MLIVAMAVLVMAIQPVPIGDDTSMVHATVSAMVSAVPMVVVLMVSQTSRACRVLTVSRATNHRALKKQEIEHRSTNCALIAESSFS